MTDATTGRSRRLLRDEVYDEIRTAILDGTLEPGEPLTDEDVMRWLNVSRPPVREALNRLADVGLVEIHAHKRTRVASLDVRDINEALFVTGVLHEASIRASVGQLDDAARDDVIRYRDEVRAVADDDDRPSLGPAVSEFFLTFERATGNQVMVDTVEAQTARLLRFLTPRQGLVSPGALADTVDAIAAAALDGDAARAGDLAHALYEPTRRNFVELHRTV